MVKTKPRTFDAYLENHLKEHPERVAGFLQAALEEYERDRDEAALLLALRHAVKAKGGMRVDLPP